VADFFPRKAMKNSLRWGITLAAAVVVLTAITVALLALRSGQAPGRAGAPPVTHASALLAPAGSAGVTRGSPGTRSACPAGQFVATVTGTQRSLVVVLRNTADSGCTLSGYPGVTVRARPLAGGPPTTLSVAVQHGGVPGRSDPGPRAIAIRPRGSASFALGITDAAGGTRYAITELRLSLPDDPVPVRAAVDLTVGTAAGAPVQIAVTAFVDGTQGP
jgi:Domain of unknown function (DUF4232)